MLTDTQKESITRKVNELESLIADSGLGGQIIVTAIGPYDKVVFNAARVMRISGNNVPWYASDC